MALLLPLLCARGRERGREGEPPAGQVLGWLGAGCVSGASALVAGTIPRWSEREVGIASSRGGRGGLTSVRALVGLGGAGCDPGGDAPSFGCVGDAGGGLRVSPFGGGLVGGSDFPR